MRKRIVCSWVTAIAVYQIIGITPEPNGIRSLLSSFSFDVTNEH